MPAVEQGTEQDALPENVQETSRCIRVAARFYRQHFTCLPQALSLWWLLRRQGITSEFRLGVRHINEQFEAHAWVEYEGIKLEDSQNPSSFVAFEQAELTRSLTGISDATR